MSDKNYITGETKDLLLAQLLANSKKYRIKSIAERYGLKLSDKLTKQQMIDAVLPAIEVNFGVKLKQYSTEDLFLAMKCFNGGEMTEQLTGAVIESAPFADGAIFLTGKSKVAGFCAAVPHELAGKLMMYCVTKCFDNSSDDLDKCAKACAAIYGRFTAGMLADCVNSAFASDVTEEQAEKYLASTDSEAFTYEDGCAVSHSGVCLDILPEASGLEYYLPDRKTIDSYAVYGADTGDYYYRQIINLIYNNAGISYDTANQLVRDISVWCTDNGNFKTVVDLIKQSDMVLSNDKFNFLLGMIGELNSRSRKPCLKGHRPDEVDEYKLPVIPEIVNVPIKPEPVRVTQKVGRNDPCPCGSGKKYKKCCGKNK